VWVMEVAVAVLYPALGCRPEGLRALMESAGNVPMRRGPCLGGAIAVLGFCPRGESRAIPSASIKLGEFADGCRADWPEGAF
jgi:hypothetical protein